MKQKLDDFNYVEFAGSDSVDRSVPNALLESKNDTKVAEFAQLISVCCKHYTGLELNKHELWVLKLSFMFIEKLSDAHQWLSQQDKMAYVKTCRRLMLAQLYLTGYGLLNTQLSASIPSAHMKKALAFVSSRILAALNSVSHGNINEIGKMKSWPKSIQDAQATCDAMISVYIDKIVDEVLADESMDKHKYLWKRSESSK